MKKKVLYSEQGICPFCGSKLVYTTNHSGVSTGVSQDFEWYRVCCEKCDLSFTEEYKLVYNDQLIGPAVEDISINNSLGKEIEVESI